MDLDGVDEVVGDPLGERHDEVTPERGATRARVSKRLRALPPGRREITDWVVPIRSASSRLAEPGLGVQVVDELPEGEVLFDACLSIGTWRPSLVVDAVPAGVVGHRVLLHGCWRAHSSAAATVHALA
jgi:hypothetical protein